MKAYHLFLWIGGRWEFRRTVRDKARLEMWLKHYKNRNMDVEVFAW